jgi:hypothetical protein
MFRRLVQQYRQKVVDIENVNNNRLKLYGLIPTIARELLFRLAGIHVFSILRFSGSKKHLGDYIKILALNRQKQGRARRFALLIKSD